MDTVTEILNGLYGGHTFPRDAQTDWPVCVHCFASISTFELTEGLWPARLGRYCPAILFKLETIPHTQGEE